ncbi:hypothetical protein [Pseudobacteriovorax antillogorgiicola]|uniref:Uncharacterized protein n=1 Tax=Pseudobacteriovorax antillogorgiicola TaxID=1513793 RepID=A0A1Y6B705_9BACT|nr:hypothetical protein [Pseudobacteriovorax antillogorgiicola]TCS59118.1 hypothetical protein EDD56_10121 [Pseudobacteriovorax antillogorgiicola]SME91637.1 hypothetical protein SAMN06296036_101465 [Pseudobacteriovorax antillogorgiicola]
MRMLNPTAENVIAHLYTEPDFLPPLWRVIYQEAVRGHHVLFDHVPHGRYASRTLTISRPGIKTGVSENLQKAVSEILKASSITDMKKIIRGLNRQERDILFHMYERAIRRWQDQLKSSLN